MNDVSPFSRAMERLRGRFERLYGAARAGLCVERARMLVGRYGVGPSAMPERTWSTADALLIAYGDSVRAPDESPLATLRRFMDERLPNVFNTVHVLPFFTYSSDDGFSVIHYRQVRPDLGTWDDLDALAAGGRRVMMDLVLNHASRSSNWFRDYVLGVAPGRDYFVEITPDMDLSRVVRPRTTPLATSVRTRAGERQVWTTFSADQMDLNFANPDVLFEFLDLIFFYYIHGARLFRLDAVAYLWKTPGTPCIHLAQTHEIVALIRDFIIMAMPDAALVAETNVPHAENISYFGGGNEARMVYQFTLPPLLMHALLTGDVRSLRSWLIGLEDPPPECTFLNFTASHDGIGVRPLEGILPEAEIERLAQHVVARVGHVSMRRTADGQERPYELNCTYFDALGFPGEPTTRHTARFLCSQTLMCALKGIPAVYFNSLLAAPNDTSLARETGRPRSLNRTLWTMESIAARLADPDSAAPRVFSSMIRMIQARASCEAFDPHGTQRVREADADSMTLTLERVSPDGRARVLAVHNLSDRPSRTEGFRECHSTDLLTGDPIPPGSLVLAPYQSRWLLAQP